VEREDLLRQLADPAGPAVVSIVAPPGYGKSTLLGQWTMRETRAVAWLTLDQLDNDPAILLTYVAAALDRIEPLTGRAVASLPGAVDRLLATAVPRLLSDLHRFGRPTVLVFDDVHRLDGHASVDVLAAIMDHLPPGFRVALAGRHEPALPLARLRANRALLELGPDRLALDAAETAALAAGAGIRLTADEARRLALRTEGWATGVYLATLARGHGSAALASVSDGDRHIAAYLDAEVAAGLPEEDVLFLTRTSILETVTPSIAEALTGLPGAAGRLRAIARSNLLVQEVERSGPTYRYHNLLRDYLRTELDRREPGAARRLHGEVAARFAAAGRLERAVEHAILSGDRSKAARLATAAAVPTLYGGRGATVERWLAGFDAAGMAAYPPLAVIAAWAHLLLGRADEADAAADIAERATYRGRPADTSASFESQRAMLRALMCRRGPREALADASLAVAAEVPGNLWRTNALWLQASALDMLGDAAGAEASLAAALDDGSPSPASGTVAYAKQAALCIRAGDWEGAERYAAQSRTLLSDLRYDALLAGLLVFAVSARVAVQRGDLPAAREHLVQAQLVRPLANHAAPWFSVDALLELARAYLAISDPGGAQLVLREAEQIIRRRPSLGVLTTELVEMRRRLSGAATVLAGSSTLTSAELRLLPLLPTYLSFQDIADRLGISRNTVKTHAMSIYGKLWASSRGEAVERAVELGLLEPYPGLAPRRPEPVGDGSPE
jgi:LuxR family maltose regulon positive regulatory protein